MGCAGRRWRIAFAAGGNGSKYAGVSVRPRTYCRYQMACIGGCASERLQPSPGKDSIERTMGNCRRARGFVFFAVKNVEQPISALASGTSPQSQLYPASTSFRARGTSRWSRPDLPRNRCTLAPSRAWSEVWWRRWHSALSPPGRSFTWSKSLASRPMSFKIMRSTSILLYSPLAPTR